MKVGTFNQEKARDCVKPIVKPMDRFTALLTMAIHGVSLPSPVDSGCVYLDILNGYKSFPDRVQNQNFTESSNLVRAQPSALA